MSLLFQTVESAGSAIQNTITGNPSWLVLGIGLFIAAAIVIFFLKNIIVHTALGLIGWAILTYVFHLNLPFLASLVASAVFGLAGLGAIVVLTVLGIIH